jgi:cephalosporin-C deacetylase
MNLFDMPLEELQHYKPALTRQDDFEPFWKKRIEENSQYPLNMEVTERVYPVPGVKVYDVYFDGFRNSRIHGVYVTPESPGTDTLQQSFFTAITGTRCSRITASST